MLRWLLLSMLLAAVTLTSAQTPHETDFNLKVDVELVQLPVSVLDKNGIPVRGLHQQHFSVYEDKVLQPITLFKQEDIPLSVGLVIDASGSMLDKRDKVGIAAMSFIKESKPDDETSVISFADEVYIDQDLTSNREILGNVLTNIQSNGGTVLYDAVFLAAKHLQRHATHEKKVLLVISDGEDNQSKYRLQQVLKVLGESKTTLYAIGLLNSVGPSMYGYPSEQGKKALKQLADATGGTSFFPKHVNEVEELCRRIARDLRNQYTIGYRPSNTKLDGSWRKVVVRLDPPPNTPKVKIRTRQGYYAPKRGDSDQGRELIGGNAGFR